MNDDPLVPSRERYRTILDRVAGRRTLVLGDVMLDRYLWGNVSRISPEAPVPIVEVESESFRLGGAANVAHNVLGLDAVPLLFGVVGQDHGGELFRRELEARRLDSSGLLVDPSRPTSIKTRIVARHQQVVRADQESREEISTGIEDRLIDLCRARIGSIEACVISDYGKGVITRRLLDALLPEFRKAGITVCVDPKETHFFAYTGVSAITPNLLEAGTAFGRALKTDALLDEAGRDLRSKLDCEAVLITRGEKGMSLFEAGRPRLDIPTVAREVYDVTGAGDTVVSVYAVTRAAGATPAEAASLANHAAGIVVREVGTAVTGRAAILDSFRRENGS